MIQRNNKYVSADKEQIKKVKKGKRLLVTLGGALLTVTLLTGCGKGKEVANNYGPIEEVQVLLESTEDVDLLSYDSDIKSIAIVGTDLTDVSELSNYQNLRRLTLRDNVLTDVSALESLPDVYYLDITNNSIDELNVQNFEKLHSLYIEGNYNLYTEDLVNYCETNGINVDINMEDVKNVDQIKEIVDSLNLEGKSTTEKEKIIYDYVISHMDYDMNALKDENLSIEYNENALTHALNEGKGVCATYAAYFDAMCEVAGIDCYEISGLSKNEYHAWNLVEIDGQYMLCDPTWGDTALPFGLYGNVVYNKTGKQAENFMKDHNEGMTLTGHKRDFEKSDVRSNLAVNSDKKAITDDSVIEETKEAEEKGPGLIERVNKIIDNIDFSKIDSKELISKVLFGIAAGSVVLLSKKTNKILKEQVKNIKLSKINKEEIKKEKKKDVVPPISELPQVYQQIVETPIVEEKPPVVEPLASKEPTFEEKLASLSDNEKVFFVENEAEEILKDAAIKQVDMEIYNRLMDSSFKDEKIQKACTELQSIINNTRYEKALYRCKKYGFLKDASLDKLSPMERESIEATIRMYDEVDDRLDDYQKMLNLLNDIKKNINQEESLNTSYGLN